MKKRISENRAESLGRTISEIDQDWNVKAYYFGVARSKGFELLRNVSKLHLDVPKLLLNVLRNYFEKSKSTSQRTLKQFGLVA